jgi:nucleoid-associated protein YgaU
MKPKYEIWLTANENRDRLQLPINPPSIDIDAGSQNTSVNVAGLGEVTILQEPGAKVFEFASLFPATYGPYCETTNIPNPWDAVNFIEKYKSNTPFRFIITNTPVNMLVSVEDFKYSEKAGDVGTIAYSLKLKEYRIVKPRQINIVIPPINKFQAPKVVPQPQPRPAPSPPRTYTVVSGDYLIKIARKVNVSDWRTIYNANRDKIKNPNLIYPGQVFVIP